MVEGHRDGYIIDLGVSTLFADEVSIVEDVVVG